MITDEFSRLSGQAQSSLSPIVVSVKSLAPFVGVALLTNLVFWSWLWVDLLRRTTTYEDRPVEFEEVVPVFKFGARVLPPLVERESLSFQSMHLLQRPSFFVASKAANHLTSRSWDQRIGPVSVGAYVLIATTLLSFFQWAAVSLFIGAGWKIVTGRHRGGS